VLRVIEANADFFVRGELQIKPMFAEPIAEGNGWFFPGANLPEGDLDRRRVGFIHGKWNGKTLANGKRPGIAIIIETGNFDMIRVDIDINLFTVEPGGGKNSSRDQEGGAD
jgi:hypothetical protein